MAGKEIDKVSTILALPGEVSRVGLQLPNNLSFDHWQAIGQQLKLAESAVMWWVGDWLNFGERKYGEKYKEAEKATGYAYDTLKQAKRVSSAIELCSRIHNLSWRHHQEVAAFEPNDQDTLLSEAEAEGWSIRDLRRAARRLKAEREYGTPDTPEGKYRVIYADPPWQYGNEQPAYHTEQAEKYRLMPLSEIAALPVKEWVEDNAVLFLWVTSPILEESFQVIEAWGFEYKAAFIWDKIKHNMGHYNSVRHELLLICVRGSCTPDVQKLFDSVVTEERTEHSRKPHVFYDIIETLYPHGRRLEMFPRNKRKGWDTYGNEVTNAQRSKVS